MNKGINNTSKCVYYLMLITALFFSLFGLLCESNPLSSINGVLTIYKSNAALITDLIGVGGLGGAFLNAGTTMLFAVMVMKFADIDFNGASIGCAFIVCGYAFFGKNLVTAIPIVLGSYICSRVKKVPFKTYSNMSLFTTCLGPFVTYIATNTIIEFSFIRIILAIFIGVFFGFVVPLVGSLTAKFHNGMLIFNIGLASGIVSTVVTGILKNFGYEFNSVLVWTFEYKKNILIFIIFLLFIYLITGIYLGGLKNYKNIFKHTGQTSGDADYVELEGFATALINMSLNGFITIIYLLIINADINGVTLSGIVTICGFGAYGMNPFNIIWAWVGIVFISFVSVWNINDPAIILAAMYCTCICSIAGKYGPIWGIIAGILHVSVAKYAAFNYGYLNLYNNGYSAGVVCIVLLPVIEYVNGIISSKNNNHDKTQK